jgi:hypothetical protein
MWALAYASSVSKRGPQRRSKCRVKWGQSTGQSTNLDNKERGKKKGWLGADGGPRSSSGVLEVVDLEETNTALAISFVDNCGVGT